MKLSLAWIFDHIQACWQDYDIHDVAARFTVTTAEIDRIDHVLIDLNMITLAQAQEQKNGSIFVYTSEWAKHITMPMRSDVQVGGFYLVKKVGSVEYAWVSLADLYADKDDLMPAVCCSLDDRAGAWKRHVEAQDYLLTIDNKSLTHRPDLWSHRGVAREIAALLEVPLVPEMDLLAIHSIKADNDRISGCKYNPYTLYNEEPGICKQFAGIYLEDIAYRPSLIPMASRLARIGSRPLNVLVDVTNYVMYDIGQPLHAFDARALNNKTITVRFAHTGEKLTLLDTTTIELTPQDCVVTDGQQPLSLAGVMGGLESSISPSTRQAFIESANFDAVTIRRTAIRHKKRTEASARFEKGLDPNQVVPSLLRFLKLLNEACIPHDAPGPIIVLGQDVAEEIIVIAHNLIEQRLGTAIAPERVHALLNRLGFGVREVSQDSVREYVITVPTFRGTGDIVLKEDIIEELGRFIGYAVLPQKLPVRPMAAYSMKVPIKIHTIKYQCAFGLRMHEVYNYALYDEEFLKVLALDIPEAVELRNPLSEHWKRLVTSLIPHLLKNISENISQHTSLRFFEWGRQWHAQAPDHIRERKMLAGILFSTTEVNFYTAKAELQTLCDSIKLSVNWRKAQGKLEPWWNPHQTAELLSGDQVIGRAGKVDQALMPRVAEGDAFIFELDADFLLTYKPPQARFIPLPKYPSVSLDVSMLVSAPLTVAELERCVASADNRIRYVTLVDFFEKKEWGNQRAVTLRYIAYDQDRTMTKEDINMIQKAVAQAVSACGAQVR